MEISVKQAEAFNRKRDAWITKWNDFEKRNRLFVEQLKDTDINTLDSMTKQKKIFDAEQAHLIAEKDEIFVEFNRITKAMIHIFNLIWPGKKIVN